MSEKRSFWSQFLAQLLLLLVLLTVLFPVLWMFAISLDGRGISRPTELPFIDPDWWANISLQNYVDVLINPKQGGNAVTYWTLLKNSLIAAGGTALLAVVVGTTAAYAFSRFRFPGRKPGLMFFIVIQMIPAVGTMAPLFVLLTMLGIRNSLLGLVVAYMAGTLPFAIWNMKGYMDTVPEELEQAALIDGCGPTQAFIRVILPLVLPALSITVLFGFAAGWTEFALAWLMLENPDAFTLAMVLRQITSGDAATRSIPWGQAFAFATLLAIPPTILFLALQRYIVGGLTAGAVKG